MSLPPLPTLWNLYNLASSPYFQGTLEAGGTSARPLSLFVGRETELHTLQGTIYGAGYHGSRQAVAGIPGVGKTTLVQELKATLLEQNYLTTDSLVPILPGDTAEAVFGRVLGMLYDTILANRPHTVDSRAMQDAQVLVRATRLPSGGANLSVFGVGAGATRSNTVLSPRDVMIDGPRVMRDLMQLVQGSDGRGVVIHVNNLESLTESEVANAAEIFRGLRDPMFMHDGLHYVVVGTTDAVNVAVNTHVQVRNIFTTISLEPLDLTDVHRLLTARYEHLRRNGSRPPLPPAEDAAVAGLYSLFRGDLRGMLKALEDGVSPLLGIAGTGEADDPSSGAGPVRPLTLDEIRPVLQKRYAAHLASLPEQTRVEQLTRWGTTQPGGTQTQKSLAKLWKVSQGAVSNALKYLTQQGYVIALPRAGGEPIQYVLSGTSRLIFG
jgi:hypothetical protein